ncbi:phosphoglycerate dehydrogenase [Bremerella sp. JC770]|uniref:phosphoglycerate dehydrogenase n=1 Tax=Bremerella sp. JC770 TaxID=3232137 RepID=UPI0034581289
MIDPPYDRRLKPSEVASLIADVDGVIAGTEPYSAETLAQAKRLKVICRVGIGLDSVDLQYCQENGIVVTFTPDEPSQAVAELTLANILNLARHIHESDASVRLGAWNRFVGSLLCELKIGILGVGRIGTKVVKLLEPFSPQILAYDSDPSVFGRPLPNVTWVPEDELIAQSDLISIHVPLTRATYHLFDRARLSRMKTGAMLINTSRGSVIDEVALLDALRQNHLRGAALDVYEHEPYSGTLAKLPNVVLSAHIGASARQTRFEMELAAAQDCVRFFSGEHVRSPAPMETPAELAGRQSR